MSFGVCRLCKKESELRKSHVIPRSVFKRALKGFTYGLILDQQYNKVVNYQDQWAGYLLCGECESNLSTRYEEYSLGVLRGEQKRVKHQNKSEYLQIVDVDQKKLILFIISILWRAIESDHEVFKNLTDLNEAELIKENLRLCICENILPEQNLFTVRVSKLVTNIEQLKNLELKFITNWSFSADKRGFLRGLLIIDGYCFEVFFPIYSTNRLFGIGVLKENKRILKIPRIEAFSIPELNSSILKILERGRK